MSSALPDTYFQWLCLEIITQNELIRLSAVIEHLKTNLGWQEIKAMLIELSNSINASVSHWYFNVYLKSPPSKLSWLQETQFWFFSSCFLFSWLQRKTWNHSFQISRRQVHFKCNITQVSRGFLLFSSNPKMSYSSWLATPEHIQVNTYDTYGRHKC